MLIDENKTRANAGKWMAEYEAKQAILADTERFRTEHPEAYEALGGMTLEAYARKNAPHVVEIAENGGKPKSEGQDRGITARAKIIDGSEFKLKTTISGFHMFFSHKLIEGVETGLMTAEGLAALIAVGIKSSAGAVAAVGAAGPFAAVTAGVVLLKSAEFIAMDLISGERGVWVPITWFQLPGATVPGVAIVIVHPLPADAPLNPWGL